MFGLHFLLALIQPVSVQEIPGGALIREPDGYLRIEALSQRTIRVRFSRDGVFPPQPVPTIINTAPTPNFTLRASPATISVTTADLTAQVQRSTGAVSFRNAAGQTFLAENPAAADPHTSFALAPDEAIYGLGQHQDGALDERGRVVKLEQQNREVAIPFAMSSRGYGLLWNNPAGAEVGVGARVAHLSGEALLDEQGRPGGLTARYYTGRDFKDLVASRTDASVDFDWSKKPPPGLSHDNYCVRWTGYLNPARTGVYTFKTVSDDGVRLWVDGRQLIDAWSVHPAQNDLGSIELAAGKRHSIRLEYFQAGGDAVVRLAELAPSNTLDWNSEVSHCVDYCVFYGPSLDRVMAEYRHRTGEAPLPPRWALGYWQSKERYATQAEWQQISSEYRRRKHPIDVLVQDWFYWDPYPWGSHEFDPNRYPDPAAGVAALHADNFHTVISVWGMFAPNKSGYPNRNLAPLADDGYLLPANLRGDGMRFYDAFNPGARKLYWEQIQDQLFDKGFDGWWLDASEPEVDMQALRRDQTAAGLGAYVLNAWPLMHTIGVSQGQLHTAPDQRVVILTRSAYAGQQRTGAVTWSGDITATWDVLANQIPAGLNFCLSGIPYWTTDIGAFFAPRSLYPGQASDPMYRELFTRWFQYGAFCPIFRVHGTDFAKEMWRFGPQAEAILDRYDRLRYRLMPYIYSQAWWVTHDGGTLMRALVMDFPADALAREVKDEFMFGPSLLICPVIQPSATSRTVYLPSGSDWVDFWTGKRLAGGRFILAAAPIERMPIFVKAGAILPLGPDEQYAGEHPHGPIELRLYPGRATKFDLYDDEGEGNSYRLDQHSVTPISWTGARLTIGPRTGNFRGMGPVDFSISVAGGIDDTRPAKDIHYTGGVVAIDVR